MTPLSDQEFCEQLDAIEGNQDVPGHLSPEDTADLQLAQRLFALRTHPATDLRPVTSTPVASKRSPRLWTLRPATVLLIAAILLVVIGAFSMIGARTLNSLRLARNEVWFPPDTVIFEGRRYDLREFERLIEDRHLEETLIIVLDTDRQGEQTFYAFANRDQALRFLKMKTRTVPDSGP